ncbi:hypothetical protein Tco_1025699 [Tanacetum coccineum]
MKMWSGHPGDEDAGDQNHNQRPDITYFQLVQDREPMKRMIQLRMRWVYQVFAKKGVRHEEDLGSKEDSWYEDHQGLESQDFEGVTIRDYDVERMSRVPYANAVGSFMYLMACTSEVDYEIFMGHCKLRLVYGTYRGNHVVITFFVDSYYAKDLDNGRCITHYEFLVHGCVISWKATLQHIMALLTTKTKYMAVKEVVKEAIWLAGLLKELGVELNNMAVNCHWGRHGSKDF